MRKFWLSGSNLDENEDLVSDLRVIVLVVRMMKKRINQMILIHNVI